ncbi:MAG: glucose dehydrogenase, partial [Gammaproteobacteria bacterium]|nr:glucose dehydrogenase [Gammaproteobacteria bacterium]
MHAFATRLLLGAVLCSAPAAWAAGCPGKDEGAGIRVPDGFCAQVFAQDVGDLRHLAVGADGTVYAALSSRRHGGGIAVLRPRGGRGELVGYFGAVQGTGIGLHGGYLYFGENDRIVRFPLASDGTPQGPMQIVVSDFP